MIYAIDFGTSNSLLGAVVGGAVRPPAPLDPAARDPSILRSVLFFPDGEKCFFGAEAVREFVRHDMEGRFIRSIKKFLPSSAFSGTQIGRQNVPIESIIGTFLGEMKRRADAHFQGRCDTVLLGRPARYSANDAEDKLAQERMEKAARIAGFQHIGFCPEPIAAAHGYSATLKEEKILLVGDFGGGTSDFTVIKIGPRPFRPEDVLAIGGVSVAGDALDGSVMRKRISKHFGADVQYQAPFGSNILTMPKHLMENICSPADISLLRERDTMEFFRNVKAWSLGEGDRRKMDQLFSLIGDQFGFELFEEIERVKRALSAGERETFSFRYPDIEIEEEITRAQFAEYSGEATRRILGCLDQTVRDAGIAVDKIDLVCSTGGTAKVVALQQGLEARFGASRVRQHDHFHSIVHGLTKIAGGL